MSHEPVLVESVLALLAPVTGEVVVDLTVGRGGHAAALGAAVMVGGAAGEGARGGARGGGGGGAGRVIGFDLDPGNLAATAGRLEAAGVPFTGFRESFVLAPRRLAELGVRADVVLADLGFSSNQMDDPARGFSFRADGPLDMRLDPFGPTTAADLVATLPEADLAELIRTSGEEPLAGRIARKLARSREGKPIESTAELARLVVEAYGGRARTSRMHPATRTFMALRIAVNEELDALRSLLESVTLAAERRGEGGWMRPGARVAVISFHSLEDRLVKHAFADLAKRGLATRLTKRPVTATPAEVLANPRSRSAKLRAVRMDGPDPG